MKPWDVARQRLFLILSILFSEDPSLPHVSASNTKREEMLSRLDGVEVYGAHGHLVDQFL
jgi:hypothetical protein